jgi:hypothetical protein
MTTNGALPRRIVKVSNCLNRQLLYKIEEGETIGERNYSMGLNVMVAKRHSHLVDNFRELSKSRFWEERAIR